MKNNKIMGISEYATSKLYKGKDITVARVWQLIDSKILELAHEKPAMVYAIKVK